MTKWFTAVKLQAICLAGPFNRYEVLCRALPQSPARAWASRCWTAWQMGRQLESLAAVAPWWCTSQARSGGSS